MRALYFERHGGVEQLRAGFVNDEAPPQPGEVLVRVRACALNHLDLWVLRGWPGLSLTFPHIGGADVAGEIAAVGDGTRGVSVGDPVVVNPGFVTREDEWTERGEDSLSPGYEILGEHRCGGFAEYVRVPETNIAPLMRGFSFIEGCAPLLVGLTSWRMLRHRAQLQSTHSVLVVGAGGGVNSFSILFASRLGAYVIALTRRAKIERAIALGAREVIDYETHREWSREVRRLTNGRGVDIVVDNVGAATMEQSLRAVCRGGTIVTVGNTSGHELQLDNRLIFTKQISILGSTMGSRKDFSDLIHWLEESQLRMPIDQVFDLADGAEAYRRLERGEQFGKIVITP